MEFVKDKASKEPFDPTVGLATAIHDEGLALDPGVMLYPGRGSVDGRRGDHIIIAPPYNVTEEQIDLIINGTWQAIENALRRTVQEN